MANELRIYDPAAVPAIIASEGLEAARVFAEYFTARIANPNTRKAYLTQCRRFLAWCMDHRLALADVRAFHVAAHLDELQRSGQSAATVKQVLSAIHGLFDWLVVKQICPSNPATHVRGPQLIREQGAKPILSDDEVAALFAAIDLGDVRGYRNRAILGTMLFAAGRVGAVLAMAVEDYFHLGQEWFVRLHEKRGREHVMPVHLRLKTFLDQYLLEAGIEGEPTWPLFCTFGRDGSPRRYRMRRPHLHRWLQGLARRAGVQTAVSPHSFRGTSITRFLENGGSLEEAQRIAGHRDIKTTRLYDHRDLKRPRPGIWSG